MNSIRSMLFTLAFFPLLTFHSQLAHGYFSTIDTGELVQPGQYQGILEPQLIVSEYNGFNLVGRFDAGIDDSSSIRGILGFGEVDFQIGGMYKFIPFPDVEGQPAIGAEAGIIYARVGTETQLSVRIHPLISKRFELEYGDLIPYASLPIGITARSDKTVGPVQVVAGAELRPISNTQLSYFVEFGTEVTNSFSYISGAVAYRFDYDALRGGNRAE